MKAIANLFLVITFVAATYSWLVLFEYGCQDDPKKTFVQRCQHGFQNYYKRFIPEKEDPKKPKTNYNPSGPKPNPPR